MTPASGARRTEVRTPHDLPGFLDLPPRPRAVVVFAHGSGSSRHSGRNAYVAQVLQRSGLATLLFDLLTEAEAGARSNVFDIDLLAGRLGDVARWAREQEGLEAAPVGLFGASTGAAAALTVAARDRDIGAVVSRGGRPDLAGDRLGEVTAPTMLIVGGADRPVLEMNREAYELLACEKQLAVVPRATHLFEEPGALEEVAALAADWFTRHLAGDSPP